MRACAFVRLSVGMRALTCACARVALIIQHAALRHIVIYGFWLRMLFRHYLMNGTIFRKKSLNIRTIFLFSLQRYFK
jgi:hypothetical protein